MAIKKGDELIWTRPNEKEDEEDEEYRVVALSDELNGKVSIKHGKRDAMECSVEQLRLDEDESSDEQ